ncbi:MAG: hypothetical protein DKT66_09485 [Candidatus Melainabacteria bacterium]|nr:MAG: hypothetical protein DKT66_09485 [Candidatus Melainabacteria bacterium]
MVLTFQLIASRDSIATGADSACMRAELGGSLFGARLTKKEGSCLGKESSRSDISSLRAGVRGFQMLT